MMLQSYSHHSIQYQASILNPDLKDSFLLVIGATGLAAGAFAGVLVSKHPVLFSTATGIQWLGLGSVFWCQWLFEKLVLSILNFWPDCRNVLIEAHVDLGPEKAQEYSHSAIAGSLSGAFNGAFRNYTEPKESNRK